MNGLEPMRATPLPEDPAGLPAFIVQQNEGSRLPHLFDWYRARGVTRFYVVDNLSTDGSADLLLAQPDVEPFLARGSYGKARAGLDWAEALMDRYADRRWCVHVDADELLVWPGAQDGGLPALIARLEVEGAEAQRAMMLDMYPDGPLVDAAYSPGQPFLDVAPCFDAAPYWREPTPGQFPDYTIRGGVRARLFYPELLARGPGRRLRGILRNQMWKLPALRGTRMERALRDPVAPDLTKIPLKRWRAGMKHRGGPHRMDPLRLSRSSAILLHFKFFADSAVRVNAQIAAGQHYQGGAEYRRYARLLSRDPRLSFAGPGTVRYAGPQDLERRGLIGMAGDTLSVAGAGA
jgi:hypothetical protein